MGNCSVYRSRRIGRLEQAMHRINRLDERLDKIDERLCAVENKISKATGWGTAMFLLLIVIQIVLKFVNISISIG